MNNEEIYFSKSKAIETFNKAFDNNTLLSHTLLAVTEEIIDKIPTEEVQSVRHGRWESWGYMFHGILWKRCSKCHKTADVSFVALSEGKIEMVTSSVCGCCGSIMEI